MDKNHPMDLPAFEGQEAGLSPQTKRHIRLQILLPVFIGVLVLLGLSVWMVVAEVGDASVWADVALLFIALPMFVLGLILLLILVALTYALNSLVGILPGPLRRVKRVMVRSSRGVERGKDVVVRPFVVLQAGWAALKAMVRGVWAILFPFGGGADE